jgi:hypothetical protein
MILKSIYSYEKDIGIIKAVFNKRENFFTTIEKGQIKL